LTIIYILGTILIVLVIFIVLWNTLGQFLLKKIAPEALPPAELKKRVDELRIKKVELEHSREEVKVRSEMNMVEKELAELENQMQALKSKNTM